MKESGKIVFYNVNDGNGMIITPKRGKFPFSVVEWDDYEQMPSVGLEVYFETNGENAVAVSVKTIEEEVSSTIKKVSQGVAADTSHRKRFDELMNNYERPSSIKLNMNPQKCLKNYFTKLDSYISKNMKYKNSSGRLNFLLMRRFIFTTFNNLAEMDVNFITPQIKKVKDDILYMSGVYDDFKIKSSFPDTAFSKIFLDKQDDYVKMQRESAEVSKELQELQTKELHLEKMMIAKQKEMQELCGDALDREDEAYRILKGTYVDIVHMCATFTERLHEDMGMMSEFCAVYKENFIESFEASSRDYEKILLHTLDAQAFIFDIILWEKAKRSRAVKRFFTESQIDGDFSSKTYLKYYLKALDKEKSSDEHKELFKLYEYLKTLESYTTVILLDDIDEILELKRLFTRAGLKMYIKTFIDEKSALAWAVSNRANLFVLSDRLQNMSALGFLERYHKRTALQPKVMLISDRDQKIFQNSGIECVVKSTEAPKEILSKMKIMIGEDNG